MAHLHSLSREPEILGKYPADIFACEGIKMKIRLSYICRQFYWANYSTGLGASLHELGHTFDLGHTSEGIMARGFDDLYRMFLVDPWIPPLRSRPQTPTNHKRPYSPQLQPQHKQVSIKAHYLTLSERPSFKAVQMPTA